MFEKTWSVLGVIGFLARKYLVFDQSPEMETSIAARRTLWHHFLMIKKSIVTVIFGFQIVALTSNARQFTKGEQLTLEYRNGWVLDSDFGRGAYQVSSFSSTPSPHLWTTILQLNVLLKSGKLTDINKFDEKSLTELAQKNIKEIRKDPEYIQMLESHAAGCGQLEIMTLPTMKPTVQERNGATK